MFELKNKKVLFITTKNLDYLRNVQELDILRAEAKVVDVIGYNESDKKYLKRLIKVYMKLLFSSCKEYDCIFIGFAPQLILPIFFFKMQKKVIIMDFFISVYDTMVFDRKKFKVNSIFAKACKWLDSKCIHMADYVISDTNAHGDYFSNEFKVEREQINTLYLHADQSIYFKKDCSKPENLKEKFIVLYFGSILPLQGIDIVLGALDILKDEKDIYFYMIGPVKDKMQIIESDSIEYIDWLPQEKLAEHIAYSDLCLAGHFNKTIDKAKRTIPGKAYIYESMEKKMILGENSANRELYKEDERHYFVPMGDSKELASMILKIKNEEKTC